MRIYVILLCIHIQLFKKEMFQAINTNPIIDLSLNYWQVGPQRIKLSLLMWNISYFWNNSILFSVHFIFSLDLNHRHKNSFNPIYGIQFDKVRNTCSHNAAYASSKIINISKGQAGNNSLEAQVTFCRNGHFMLI